MTTRTWSSEIRYHAPYPLIALTGSGLAVLAAFAAVLSGLGSRWGWWHFGTGFKMLLAAAGIGLIAAIADLWSAVRIRGRAARHVLMVALGGALIGLAATGVPAVWIAEAYSMPAIHDITTDPDDPPAFRAIMPLRQDAANPAEYGGAGVAAQQHKAYPQVRPLILPLAPREAFDRALAEARKMGWNVVAADASVGRIEATAETFWFGFKDDIVVRVRADDFGSRVDVRSVSRVGIGDLGTNARRIMKYLVALGMAAG